jgi:hypothetical protein
LRGVVEAPARLALVLDPVAMLEPSTIHVLDI